MSLECLAPHPNPTWRDRYLDIKYAAKNYANLAKSGLRLGPLRMVGDLFRYRWMTRLLNPNFLLKMATMTRTGPYKEANALVMTGIVEGALKILEDIYTRPGRHVLHEDLVTAELLYGMDLAPWQGEMLSVLGPMVEIAFAQRYLDAAVEAGYPPDMCGLNQTTVGLALEGQIPKPRAIVTSNMPCDASLASYTGISRALGGVPVFRLDTPWGFYSERAVDYFVVQLKEMIAFLEEHTEGRMDWDRLREVCERRNAAHEYESALWDLMREKPAPMAGEPVYFGSLMHMTLSPGTPESVEYWKRMVQIAGKLRKRGGALPDERFRCAMWNAPTLPMPELFVWAEQKWGVALLMEMLTYHREQYIDTKSPETMLRGIARIIMQTPMARHARGPMDNFFSDLFHLYEYFGLDMIWLGGQIGCKNALATCGVLREKCRERGIPLLILDFDIADARVMSPAGIREQAERFMETVMHAEPL
ncbi:MAG: 2-hydroxyacyl-CoA dehydratase [Deltaproteobacteria bacterium]|nr:2-hydroxyacyl-CoA dehydratase [Deltaproteobacteria bacterium]